jgi:hypothetical protein
MNELVEEETNNVAIKYLPVDTPGRAGKIGAISDIPSAVGISDLEWEKKYR